MWAMHLNGAYQLLQQYGSLEKCRYNPRMRAQLAMLLWYVEGPCFEAFVGSI